MHVANSTGQTGGVVAADEPGTCCGSRILNLHKDLYMGCIVLHGVGVKF